MANCWTHRPISQVRVTTRLMCGGIFRNHLTANLPPNQSVKELWKSVNIWRSCRVWWSTLLEHSVDRDQCAARPCITVTTPLCWHAENIRNSFKISKTNVKLIYWHRWRYREFKVTTKVTSWQLTCRFWRLYIATPLMKMPVRDYSFVTCSTSYSRLQCQRR